LNSPDPNTVAPAEEGEAAGASPVEAMAPAAGGVETELAAARAEAADYKDKFLRAKAETENVRRRAEQEVAAARKFAIESFAAEVLAVHDSLDLARTVELDKGNAEAVRKMHEGLELTLKLMDGVFERFGISQINPQGEKFDPERHQAISAVESRQVPPNHVVTVVQKGYLLRERLLRPAMVVVARSGGNPAEKA
jgi:molecular chaperone GrpE